MCVAVVSRPSGFQAYDGIISGTISQIELNRGTLPLGVFISNMTSPYCGSSTNWGYLATADSNYSVMAASLLSARAQELTVELYMTRDASGYCHIVDVITH